MTRAKSRRTFTRLVRKLESHPISTRVPPAPGAQRVKVVLDGGALANWLLLMALGPPSYPTVPNWIDQLAAGRPQNIAASWASMSQQPTTGLQYGVVCSEWVPYERNSKLLEEGRRAFPRYPDSVLAQAPRVPFAFDDCGVWGRPQGTRRAARGHPKHHPDTADLGELRRRHPAELGAACRPDLPNSTLVTIPGVGHDPVAKSPCAQRVTASFLANPSAPDTACVARLSPPTLR